MSGLNARFQAFTAPHVQADVVGYTTRRLNASVSDRHAHVERLFELVVHLCSLARTDTTAVQLARAWRALCSCPEFDVDLSWRLGLLVIDKTRLSEDEGGPETTARRKRKWISRAREHRIERVTKFAEYVLCLADAGEHAEALDELEAVLPSHPYNDSVHLNVLAGQLCLYLAQPDSGDTRIAIDRAASQPGTSQNRKKKKKGRRRRLNFDDSSSSSSGSSDESDRGVESQGPLKEEEEQRTIELLRLCEQNDARLFDRARDHFERARELEREDVELYYNEGARWCSLVCLVLLEIVYALADTSE